VRDFQVNSARMMGLNGEWFDPFDPQRDELDMHSVAVGLSNQGRYNGLTNGFYSVAQHATIMSYWAEDIYEGHNPEIAKIALLHDAAEAWIGDVPAPIRQHLPLLDKLEANVMSMIMEMHGLPTNAWRSDEIAELDAIMFNTEIRDLKPHDDPLMPEICIPADHVTINPQEPRFAFQNFVMRYNQLFPDLQIVGPHSF